MAQAFSFAKLTLLHPPRFSPHRRKRKKCSPTITSQALQTSETLSQANSSTSLHLNNEFTTSCGFPDPLTARSLSSLKIIHAQMLKCDKGTHFSGMEKLIRMYIYFDNYQLAGAACYLALVSRTLSWDFIVELFVDNESNSRGILLLFRELHRFQIRIPVGFLVSILEISSELSEWNLGFSIHAYVIKLGFADEILIKCRLMELYANCNSIDSSYHIFNEAPIRDSVLWNRLVALYVEKRLDAESLQLYNEMHYSGITGDTITISKVLHACGKLEALREGKAIHAQTVKSGLSYNPLVSNSLITMYSKNLSINDARKAFELIEDKCVVSWNSIISSCCQNGFLDEALEFLDCMVEAGLKPDLVTWNCLLSGYSHNGHDDKVFTVLSAIVTNRFRVTSKTISSVLRSISNLRFLRYCKEIHGYVVRHGFMSDLYIVTSIVDMYMKCGSLSSSQRVFDSMKKRNCLTWNALISGYLQVGQLGKALELIKDMQCKGFKPNLSTWNALISGYAMQGLSKQALIMIRRIKSDGLKPNVVTWTSLISGFCQKGEYGEAFYFLSEMLKEGIEPNSNTVSALIGACAAVPLLTKGMELHCFAIRRVFDGDTYVSTALVDMYGKSGILRNAHNVFKRIGNKNSVSWNVMMTGLSSHGHGQESIRLFEEMLRSGTLPDSVTFTALLSGCRHSGLIDEAWKYFNLMQNWYSITPTIEHYTCMIDLLAKKGYLDEAMDLIKKIPGEPDACVWGAILNGSKIYKDLELAKMAASKLYRLEPHNPAIYFMMISMYANENRWDDVENIKLMMTALGLKTRYGWSWTEINKKVHMFDMEGLNHPEMEEIQNKIHWLAREMGKIGYIQDISVVSQNVEPEEKVQLLMGHTEKLAVTYGLLHTNSTRPIRVVKSTRVCNDCHTWAKYLSRFSGRQFIIRDSVRFHHFVNGECSCKDYW